MCRLVRVQLVKSVPTIFQCLMQPQLLVVVLMVTHTVGIWEKCTPILSITTAADAARYANDQRFDGAISAILISSNVQ